ncbi:MAG: hypothetical protein DPW22_06590, partial [Alphaproteobacteria bacterium]|nr:hypothetical protein [Alphaproteobacteria bacterium]
IAGHPEGHPLLAPETLDRMLAAKIDAAEQSGLSVEIVTQFCFDAAAIVRALADAREDRRLGDVGAHFFSFGGVDATARWVAAAAAGRIALDRAGGFTVNQA